MPVTGDLLLLGSVARPQDGWSEEDVLRNCARVVGPYVSMLPDGEGGDRSLWINFIARRVFPGHPDLITTSGHTYDDWKPRSYGDMWRVTVRKGVDATSIDRIGYADEAKRSYETFRRLRDEGVIPPHVRFMVALPLTESGTRGFVGNARDFEVLWAAYRDALAREISEIAGLIPPGDLAIQWDMARETAAVEGTEAHFPDADLRALPADPMERYCRALAELSRDIPEQAWLGLHVCYGSLGHREGESADSSHFAPIRDLGVAVAMLNHGVRACGRRVDFAHAPVQFSAGPDDAHYAPLRDLDVGGTRLYLGLIDQTDGVAGALRRAGVARRHLADFGLATACGWGRRPLTETVGSLLRLERDVAEAIRGRFG